ncbi:MAG: diacylglycerol kinase family lipid kinase [Bacteroidales bacterium]|nr:diacylglycerol kinase family lipid kinase [Bacteroidales bacterium]
MKKKMLFIVNPVSGVGKQKKIESVIKENLDQDLFDYSVRYTERIHHGTEIAREAADQGYDCVVAVGGDGSVNDVAQGLKDSNTFMGIIPCGSGNGLARSLKIPLKPAAAIKLLNQQNEHTIDSIVINDKYISVNAAGVGFDAYIARLMKAAKTRGFAAYTNLILREYASYKNNTYRLTVDGRTLERSAWFIAIANGRQFGYNLSVAPKAQLSDGLIDISIIDKIPLDHILITAPMAFMNLLDHSQHAEMFRAKDIVIEGNVHKWVNIDGEGENLGSVLHFVNHPASVKIYARK